MCSTFYVMPCCGPLKKIFGKFPYWQTEHSGCGLKTISKQDSCSANSMKPSQNYLSDYLWITGLCHSACWDPLLSVCASAQYQCVIVSKWRSHLGRVVWANTVCIYKGCLQFLKASFLKTAVFNMQICKFLFMSQTLFI